MEAEARGSSEGSKRKRRLPAGMSDYQAAWITEEEMQDMGDSGNEEEDETAERQGGDAEPRFGEGVMDGATSTADLDEEDDQTDDMQVNTVLHMLAFVPISCSLLSFKFYANMCFKPMQLCASSSHDHVQHNVPSACCFSSLAALHCVKLAERQLQSRNATSTACLQS